MVCYILLQDEDDQCDSTVDAYLVVFSVDSRASFGAAIERLNTLRESHGTDRAIILVANKIDLVRRRMVSSEGTLYLSFCTGCFIDFNYLLCNLFINIKLLYFFGVHAWVAYIVVKGYLNNYTNRTIILCPLNTKELYRQMSRHIWIFKHIAPHFFKVNISL